ncbi:MAG: hypothetical protein CL701_06380 [Chloroflexi bacterium]|nr:hypothetical protein [Chloroflexota bacterium]|tara:strand:- start:257 stop:685 length:429 start_codon:yes stop_codon:yes gene_type:complete
MEPRQRDELRIAMETQFRYKFYNSTEFPFLHSIGVNHIIQGFEAPDELGYIGALHLWWAPDESDIVYDKPRKFKVIGTWHGEWLDRPEEAVELAIQIQANRPYNEDKLIEVAIRHAKKMANLSVKKMVKDALEKEDEPDLLN